MAFDNKRKMIYYVENHLLQFETTKHLIMCEKQNVY